MQWFDVRESTDVAAARRFALELCKLLGFDDTASGAVAVLVSEAGTNMRKHAGGGELLLRALEGDCGFGIEILALDRGSGIVDVDASMRDGVSTHGTPGNGLGAMRRMADEFDVYSRPGHGSVFCMRRWVQPQPPRPWSLGVVCLPMRGESACGDAWSAGWNSASAALLVVDGLGHGPAAATAAQRAVNTFRERVERAPVPQLQALHGALHGTRGAAVAVVELHRAGHKLNFAGVGNIAVCVVASGVRKQFISHNGIVGHNMQRVQEFNGDWPADAVLVMHSDGLASQWDLNRYPGLCERDPAVIAAVLYRDFCRQRDDVTVLVARQQEAAAELCEPPF